MTATWEPVPEPGPDDTPPVGMVEIDVPDPEKCPIGIEGHTWRVTIEENCLGYEPLEKCTGSCHPAELGGLGITDYIEAELGLYRFRWWGCGNPGGWHYDQPCDCDQGWTIDPVPVRHGSMPAVADLLEAVAAAASDEDLTVDDLAGWLRAVEDVRNRSQIVAGEIRRALLAHVEKFKPVDTAYGRLKRDRDGDTTEWFHQRTARVVAGLVLGKDPSEETERVLAAVLDIAQITGWKKTPLREQLGIEPDSEPKRPKPGVTYLGLCERHEGRDTVRFETATKPPTSPPEPAGADS